MGAWRRDSVPTGFGPERPSWRCRVAACVVAGGIRIGNMSLGAAGCSDGTDSLSTAVNNAVTAGIVMMVAAGNEGPNRCTIGAPGAAASAVTVGAVYDPGERGWVLAEFSSRGPTADGRIKPDVTAPGRNITAAKAGSTRGYVTYSGTSMATPFIAGTAALMLDANYGLTPSQVKSLLTASGNVKDFGPGGKDIDWGAGISIAYNAVKAAGGYSGSFSDGLQHAYWAGSLSGSGDSDVYSVTVTDASRPLGLTMNMASNRYLKHRHLFQAADPHGSAVPVLPDHVPVPASRFLRDRLPGGRSSIPSTGV
ncbi:S8 family serine peptidase [Thermaerobacter sp. FW80]|uniref:S8 family serine peptidase n=1 Tax=Thermaerobacter sp. FW80 TaxID=2546351 RepID=UPI001FAB2908|nr:S8 family serine peptidase [Thermaerobacter sp. FW80]